MINRASPPWCPDPSRGRSPFFLRQGAENVDSDLSWEVPWVIAPAESHPRRRMIVTTPATTVRPGSGGASGGSRSGLHPSFLRAFLLPFLGALLSCDIPTDAPESHQRWILPGEETRVGVEDLLPDAVTVTPDGSAFAVKVDPLSFEESLGDLCAPCVPLNGLMASKPAFQNAFQDTAPLPGDVKGATAR